MDQLLENKIFISVAFTVLMFVILKIIKIIFHKIKQKKEVGIGFIFFRGLIQAMVVIIIIFIIGNQFEGFKKFYNAVLMSSSLIVLLLGFILQESLSNIVHGVSLIIFKPFEIGSRVKLVNLNISGVVTNINLNSTMIQNLFTSAILIIPNSVIAKEIIENFHYEEALHKYYFDIQISYLSDIDVAMELIKEIVAKYSLDVRTDQEKKDNKEPVEVLVQNLDIYGIHLRCPVYTEDIAENFQACSNIRYDLVKAFHLHNIRIPYSQDIKVEN